MDRDGEPKAWSSLSCKDGVCEATVYAERVWDTDNNVGYAIEAMNEKAYTFVAWYSVYAEQCPTGGSSGDSSGRLLQGNLDDRLSANGSGTQCADLSGYSTEA